MATVAFSCEWGRISKPCLVDCRTGKTADSVKPPNQSVRRKTVLHCARENNKHNAKIFSIVEIQLKTQHYLCCPVTERLLVEGTSSARATGNAYELVNKPNTYHTVVI